MSRTVGNEAEAHAAAYLQKCGVRLSARNYACREGEIDIIGWDGAVLVFFEVRRRDDLQAAADSIDGGKQRRIQRAAEHYLTTLHDEPPCRFDAVLVKNGGDIRWIQDAFWARG